MCAGAVHVFVEECGALEQPEHTLAAASAAAALYVVRCAKGALQPETLDLPPGPLVAAARSAAAGAQASSGALAEAVALLDTLVSARETAARSSELEHLVKLLSGKAGLEMAAVDILNQVSRNSRR